MPEAVASPPRSDDIVFVDESGDHSLESVHVDHPIVVLEGMPFGGAHAVAQGDELKVFP